MSLLKKYERGEFDEAFFDELDAENGASRLAKLIIEECTELNLLVGKAVNQAHKESELNFELSMRMNLVDQLKECVENMGKKSQCEILLSQKGTGLFQSGPWYF